MKNLIQSIKYNLLSIPGWKTNRKIVVFESDDWGTLRTPSNEALNKIKEKFDVEFNPYIIYDSLESENDLNALLETLKSIKNNQNQNPIFTANCIMANPNFDKIRKSDLNEYHYELVSDTFHNHKESQNCLALWKNGSEENLFKPQFHGREHLNVSLWLKLLQTDEMTKMMFDYNFWGIVSKGESDFVRKNSMAGCNYSSETELAFIQTSLLEGLEHFEALLGFSSKSFIANNYIWDDKIETVLYKKRVSYIQGQSFQSFPAFTRKKINKSGKRNLLGNKNNINQIYLTRNCFFEPCTDINFNDSISSCLNEVNTSFRWNKPAIISSHRVNYIGSLTENNRKTGLEKLKLLIETIIKKYPEVEFMTSDQLGDLIINEKN